MSVSELYWITRLDGITTLFEVLSFVLGMTLAGSTMLFIAVRATGEKHKYKMTRILFASMMAFFLVAITIRILTPTTKEMLAIKAVNFATTNERVTTTADKAFTLIEQYIDSKLKKEEKGK